MSSSSNRRRSGGGGGTLGLIRPDLIGWDAARDWYLFYRAPQSTEWKYQNPYKGQTEAQMKTHAAQWITSATIPEGGCAGILAVPARAGTPPSWLMCKRTGRPMRAFLRGVDGAETLLETDEDGTLSGLPEGEARLAVGRNEGVMWPPLP